jgi:hypothetical protein
MPFTGHRAGRVRVSPTRHSPHSTLSIHYTLEATYTSSINLTLLEGETRRTDGAQAWGMGATS